MKTLLNSAVALAIPGVLAAQNLVPNPSFEVLDSCPSTISEIEAAPPWRTFRGSVDLFNVCDTSGYASVPSNYFGYQEPFEGSGYAGLISYVAFDSLHREFMGAELLAPLTPGVPVYVSFRLAIAGWSVAGPTTNLSTNGVSAFFSTVPFVQLNSSDPLPDWTAIHCAVVPADTAQWTLVSGEYLPDSAYTQIVIGIPLNSSELQVVLMDSTFLTPGGAYVFIDEVCVSETASDCPLALGQIPALTGRTRAPFPNPCDDHLSLHVGGGSGIPDWYELYDMHGALVRIGSSRGSGNTAIIDTSVRPRGVFVADLLANHAHLQVHHSAS